MNPKSFLPTLEPSLASQSKATGLTVLRKLNPSGMSTIFVLSLESDNDEIEV